MVKLKKEHWLAITTWMHNHCELCGLDRWARLIFCCPSWVLNWHWSTDTVLIRITTTITHFTLYQNSYKADILFHAPLNDWWKLIWVHQALISQKKSIWTSTKILQCWWKVCYLAILYHISHTNLGILNFNLFTVTLISKKRLWMNLSVIWGGALSRLGIEKNLFQEG